MPVIQNDTDTRVRENKLGIIQWNKLLFLSLHKNDDWNTLTGVWNQRHYYKGEKNAGILFLSQNWSTIRNTLRMPNSLVSHGLSSSTNVCSSETRTTTFYFIFIMRYRTTSKRRAFGGQASGDPLPPPFTTLNQPFAKVLSRPVLVA